MSNEAWFYFNGFVNAQDTLIGKSKIPTQYMKPNFMTKNWMRGVQLVVRE
jgi:hypothetical protein